MRVFIGIFLAIFIGLFFTATPGKAVEPIKIGSVTTMLDATSIVGLRGSQLAVKQINDSGGLLGRKVELIVADDEGKPEKAAALLEKLATADKVDFFQGGFLSSTTLAMIPGMIKYGKVTVWTGAASSKIEEALTGQNWFFHMYPWDYQIWPMVYKGFAQVLQKYGDVKLKKVFMAYEEGPYGIGYFAGAKATFETAGIEIRGETFKSAMVGGTDYRAILKHAKKYKPDLFMWIGFDKDATPMLTQSREVGFNPPLYAGWPPAWPLAIRSSPLSDGVIFLSFWDEVVKYTSKPSKAFCDAYFKEYKEAPQSFTAPYTYSSIMIIADAVKRAGSLDKVDLIKALEATNYDSALGDRFVFGKSKFIDHQTYPLLKLMQYQNGKVAVVWPWEMATAKLKYPFPSKGVSTAAELKQSASVKGAAKPKGKK
jgi:branched-chain amino acid transport system substrate-binding protein